jgi:hypothetical protein
MNDTVKIKMIDGVLTFLCPGEVTMVDGEAVEAVAKLFNDGKIDIVAFSTE